MKRELVIVIDFGGQYNQLVARRVRECNVYCEIYSYKTDLEKIKAMNPMGIILTGGPNSCYEVDSPTYKKELFELGIPVLGLCYGAQLMMHVLGGKVELSDVKEYGKTEVLVDKKDSKIFENVSEKTICWMSQDQQYSGNPSITGAGCSGRCKTSYYRRRCRTWLICDSVSSGSTSFCRRNKDAIQFCAWSLRMCR